MSEQLPLLKRIIVMAHPNVVDGTQEAARIAARLEEMGVTAVSGLLSDETLRSSVQSIEFDLIIALGGDGTMLRAGHLGGPSNIPILGINMGHFGFLMEVRQPQWRDVLGPLLEGNYWLEKRMMLCAEKWRGDEKIGAWDVLNEVVVSRGQVVRPVQLTASIDGRFLTTYVADGLIAATPTGSTGYAMAAGGPILPPELRNILLVPVAPHLSIDRAIVLAEGSYVSITVKTEYQAVMSIDGQPPIPVQNEDRVEARAGDHTVKFIRFQDPGYFYRNLTPHMSQNPSIGNHR
jgi:NAD+ kinase